MIEAAKNSSNRVQGRIHNIHESVIRRWRKQISEEKIKEAVNCPEKFKFKNRIPGAGRKRRFPELEKELNEWVTDLKSKSHQVTKDLVKEKALTLDNGEKFVASHSFARFMKEINDEESNQTGINELLSNNVQSENGHTISDGGHFINSHLDTNDPNCQNVDMILNNEEEIPSVQTKNPSNHEILQNNDTEVVTGEEITEDSYEHLENSIFIKEEPVQWT